MNILLINPPAIRGVKYSREGRCSDREEINGVVKPPYTLALMSAIFEHEGIYPVLIDCIGLEMEMNDVVCFLEKRSFMPEIVFMPTVTPTYIGDMEAAEHLSNKYNCNIYVFGSHVTARPKECLMDYVFVNGVIIGEPEINALEVYFALAGGEHNRIDEIQGVLTRTNVNRNHNNYSPKIDLDNAPFPNWDEIPLEKYTIPILNENYVMVETSRGCPVSCSFCIVGSIHGRECRIRKASRIIEEIHHVNARYNISFIDFWADNFAFSNKQITELCEQIISSKLHIRWIASLRADTINAGLAALMKLAGCWMVSLGIESVDPATRCDMNKCLEQNVIKKGIKHLRDANILVFGYFILGYPGQSNKSMENVANDAVALNLDFATFYPVVPLPGTRLFDDCLANNSIKTYDWSKYEYSYYILKNGRLSGDNVIKYQRDAYKKFYLRVGFIRMLITKFPFKQLAKTVLMRSYAFILWIIKK